VVAKREDAYTTEADSIAVARAKTILKFLFVSLPFLNSLAFNRKSGISQYLIHVSNLKYIGMESILAGSLEQKNITLRNWCKETSWWLWFENRLLRVGVSA
jgi:hypothetical protein